MTTPRIEEMVEEVDSIIANYHGTFMGPNEREDVRQALTQAHQAGIDEAVDAIPPNPYNKKDPEEYANFLIYQAIAVNIRGKIKALQNNM